MGYRKIRDDYHTHPRTAGLSPLARDILTQGILCNIAGILERSPYRIASMSGGSTTTVDVEMVISVLVERGLVMWWPDLETMWVKEAADEQAPNSKAWNAVRSVLSSQPDCVRDAFSARYPDLELSRKRAVDTVCVVENCERNTVCGVESDAQDTVYQSPTTEHLDGIPGSDSIPVHNKSKSSNRRKSKNKRESRGCGGGWGDGDRAVLTALNAARSSLGLTGEIGETDGNLSLIRRPLGHGHTVAEWLTVIRRAAEGARREGNTKYFRLSTLCRTGVGTGQGGRAGAGNFERLLESSDLEPTAAAPQTADEAAAYAAANPGQSVPHWRLSERLGWTKRP